MFWEVPISDAVMVWRTCWPTLQRPSKRQEPPEIIWFPCGQWPELVWAASRCQTEPFLTTTRAPQAKGLSPVAAPAARLRFCSLAFRAEGLWSRVAFKLGAALSPYHHVKCSLLWVKGGVVFGALFVGALFFCGWLVSARTVPLLQAVAGKMLNC